MKTTCKKRLPPKSRKETLGRDFGSATNGQTAPGVLSHFTPVLKCSSNVGAVTWFDIARESVKKIDWARQKSLCGHRVVLESFMKGVHMRKSKIQKCESQYKDLEVPEGNLRRSLHEMELERYVEGISKRAREKIFHSEREAREKLMGIEEEMKLNNKFTSMCKADDSESEAGKVAMRVFNEAIPKFLTKFSIVMRGRVVFWANGCVHNTRVKERCL